MKIQHLRIFILTTVIGVVLVKWACPCFGENQESALMLKNKIIENEAAMRGGRILDYYSQASSIANDIASTHTQAGINTVAALFLQNLMAREVPPAEIGADDLWIMGKISATLLSATDVSETDRQEIVLLLSKFLGRIRSEIVPGYVPKHVVANVPLPEGVAGMAGMNPEAISDPIAQAKYEASIRENQENNRINSRQVALRRLDKQMSRPVVEYIIQTLGANVAPRELVEQCIRDARLNDSEKAEVIQEIDRGSR